MSLLFLSSGLFLGWSLGANDAANVFGTAVGSRMVRFRTAAIICGGFVIIGAVTGGSGTSHTMQMLGAVTELGGCFTIALCAALTILWMTRVGLPVSTTQAVVGSILGWNLFTATDTDIATLEGILASWVISPLLAALVAGLLLLVLKGVVPRMRIHLFRIDSYTRVALIIAGALGSYSLGANNIANVMGIFVPASPFTRHDLLLGMSISSSQQLFLLGGVAIAVGVYTYSKRVIYTVGNEIMKLSPMAAFVVVLSHGIVLFMFSSQHLRAWLLARGLPALPLVPISSSHAVIGAVVGIGVLQGTRGIRFRVLGDVAAGWVITPVVAGALCFLVLFFVQNVFELPVHESTATRSTLSSFENRGSRYERQPTNTAWMFDDAHGRPSRRESGSCIWYLSFLPQIRNPKSKTQCPSLADSPSPRDRYPCSDLTYSRDPAYCQLLTANSQHPVSPFRRFAKDLTSHHSDSPTLRCPATPLSRCAIGFSQ